MDALTLPERLRDLPGFAERAGLGATDPRYQAAALRLRTLDPCAFGVALGVRGFARHHELMLEAVRRVFESATDRVCLIDAPPGSGKSQTAVIVGASYILARDPAARIIIGCNSETLAEHWGRALRNRIDTPAWRELAAYRGAIGPLESLVLMHDTRAASRFMLQGGGSVLAVGHGSNLLGHRCDFLLLDDLVDSFETAFSEVQLAKIAAWLRTDALSRLDARVKVISTMQRMAYNDPHGVMAREFAYVPALELEHLTFRMECESPRDDPLGRAPGELLWPAHYSAASVALARKDAINWQTRYQQRPIVSTGEWCRPAWIVYDEAPPPSEHCRVYLTSDFAAGSVRGDYTVHFAVAVRRVEGQLHLYVLDGYRERVDPHGGVAAAYDLAARHDAHEWYAEDDAIARTLHGFISERNRTASHKLHLRLSPIRARDKETRAAPLRALLADHRVHLPPSAPWVAGLVEELTLFPHGGDVPGVDDRVDALAVLARELARLAGRTPLESEPLVVYRFPDGETIALPKLPPMLTRGVSL